MSLKDGVVTMLLPVTGLMPTSHYLPLGGGSSAVRQVASAAGSAASSKVALVVAFVALVILSSLFIAMRLKRRQAPRGSVAALPTAELNTRANHLLVGLDDALRSSATELSFARAQFGPQAVAEFTAVLHGAREKLTEAFRLRQLLDDGVLDTEEQARDALFYIVTLGTTISSKLDAYSQRFHALRDTSPRALSMLGETSQQLQTVQGLIPAARQQLATLRDRYSPAAFATVCANITQAEVLSAAGASAIEKGQQLRDTDPAAVETVAKCAEQAVAQAAMLLADLDATLEGLAASEAFLTDRLAATNRALEAARALTTPDPVLTAAIARAQAAIGLANRSHPWQQLPEIIEAEAQLSAALAPSDLSCGQTGQDLAPRLVLHLERQQQLTDNFLTTHRGTIGPIARTRFAEGSRTLAALSAEDMQANAGQLQTTLVELLRAHLLFVAAQTQALADVADFSRCDGAGPWDAHYRGEMNWDQQRRALCVGGILDHLVFSTDSSQWATRGWGGVRWDGSNATAYFASSCAALPGQDEATSWQGGQSAAANWGNDSRAQAVAGWS